MDTSSHVNNTNNNGATITPRPLPARVLHENLRRILHSSDLRGSMAELKDRFKENFEEINRLRISAELHWDTINTLRDERDGLRSELEWLRETIDEMWYHELHITNERDDLLNTTHELQRAMLTKNQALNNLLTVSKKPQNAMLTQSRNNVNLLNENNKLLRALFIRNFDDMHII